MFAQHDLIANDPELIQLKFNHENDLDDIPETNDPYELSQIDHKIHHRGQPFKTVNELLQEKQDIKNQHDADEVAQLQKDQLKDEWNSAVHA